MLLHEFDPAADAVLNPQMCVDPIPHFPPVTVACFSHRLFEQALSFFDSPTVLATLHSAAGRKPLYQVRYRGQDFAFYQASVGEPMCVKEYEDIMAMGSRRLILRWGPAAFWIARSRIAASSSPHRPSATRDAAITMRRPAT